MARLQCLHEMETGRTSSLRTAVRMCRRSVRAGAFACELATRRRWLGAGDAHWIAENLSALRGWTVEVKGGAPPPGASALVIAEPCRVAALALLAAAPLASVGRSLAAQSDAWWPCGAGAPVLLSTRDKAELDLLASERAVIVPVAVELAPPPPGRGSRPLGWPPSAGVTEVRLWFGAPLDVGDGAAGAGRDPAARARDQIERMLARAG